MALFVDVNGVVKILMQAMDSNETIDNPTPQDLIEAGRDLIRQSKLAKVNPENGLVDATDEVHFEAMVHQGGSQHRRLASWILFTTGAEYIVKGVCLEFGIGQFTQNPRTGEPDLGTLGPYYKPGKKNGQVPYLRQLARTTGRPKPEEVADGLIRWCTNLADIRNRDVHVFIRNVRGKRNFPQLDSGLLPLLNFLLELHNERQSSLAR